VSIVVVAAIIVGGYFYMRRRRIRQIEEDHRRTAAVNSFIGASKPPSSSGGFSITDSRLDPVMAQRRISNGSIADNQDYSRKILRVSGFFSRITFVLRLTFHAIRLPTHEFPRHNQKI
jgi:cell wall integrity and stress response component